MMAAGTGMAGEVAGMAASCHMMKYDERLERKIRKKMRRKKRS